MMTETESANQVRVFVEALERLGYDADSLINAAGFVRADLNDPDARVPCAAVAAMFQRAMQERPMRNLGMRIAAATAIGAYPLIDYLVVTSESVGDGLKQLSRYFRLAGSPVHMNVREDEDPVRVIYEGDPSLTFGYEYGVSLCILHLREETENRFRAEYASFVHHPDDIREMERTLSCPVHPFQSWNGWAISRDVWQLPLRRRDPILRRLLERQANEMIAQLPRTDRPVPKVRRILISRVAGGDTSIEAVARVLGVSARSLQRQLAAEGISYREVLDATRKDAAERYLANSSMSITEVAYLLGFSDATAFHRAFKRWSGDTPAAFRHQHVLTDKRSQEE
jgi:AraC-like DNA-binding protein